MWDELKENLKEKFEYWGQDIRDDDLLDWPKHDLAKAIAESDCFKLYRYVPPTYFNIRNIETQTIHLSSNGNMNDIYEGLPSAVSQLPNRKLQELGDLAMMTCMAERNDNMLMWSHYADKHNGICIEYDLKRLKNDPFKILDHLFPIVYSQRRMIKRDIDSLISSNYALKKAISEKYEYDGDESLDDILPLFLTKGKDWEYENEWRIIYTKKQMYDIDAYKLYEGNLKFECISAIYLGYRIHPEIKKNIIEICQRIGKPGKEVPVFQANLDNDMYVIAFESVS